MDEGLHGVLTVLATPFGPGGEVDEPSLRSLVRHVLAWGAHGVVCFGLAGEAYKLDDAERRWVLTAVVDEVGGRVPVVAGTEHSGTAAAVARSVEAQALGAAAVMVYPPTFVKPDPAGVTDYYLRIARATDVPVVVQDAPAWTGVPLPAALLRELREAAPRISWAKLEQPPIAAKARALADCGFRVLAGYGAVHLAEDLASGVVGVMPGCACTGAYREVWDAHARGDRGGVFARHAALLPLLSFQMATLDTFVGVQKTLLARTGVIRDPHVRGPAVPLSSPQRAWLDHLVDRLALAPYLAPAPADRSA